MKEPHRKITVYLKLSADSWRDVQATFKHLETEIAIHDELPSSSVSGGFSTGHILVCDVDGNMDHDKWAADLDAYLEARKSPTPEAK